MLMIVNDVQIKSGQLPLSETPKGPREGAPEERVSARAVNDTVTLSDSGQKMVNPVFFSPIMMGQLMELGPRCSGSSDGWYWMVP